jgi:hypothetical protein
MLGAAALAVGCASRGQMDILESRLRQQEDSIVQLQGQLSTSESQLQASRREAADLRTQLADGTRTARVEQLSALGQVEAIELNRYLTGGLDRDGKSGDELLSAMIVPKDAQGNLVKAPGSVSVTVFDLSKPEAQQRIGRWDFSPKESESLWMSSFLWSGYVVRVPWQKRPQSTNLLVLARLKTIDGRQFDTSQTIKIVPPPLGAATPSQSVAAAGAIERPDETSAAVVPASADSTSVLPATGAADQPVAKKATAAETAWWDEPKQPPATGSDAQPPRDPQGSKSE